MDPGEHWDPRPAHTVLPCRKKLDDWLAAGMRGLVIDVSDHNGGSYRPALHAVGAHLLRRCEVFSMVNGNESRCIRVTYDGERQNEEETRKKHGTVNNRLSAPPGFRVAVVVSEHTASSGEMVAAMFHGKENVRTFGRSATTAGALSINQGYALAGNLQLLLTILLVRTTDGVRHDDEALVPDVVTSRPVTEAVRWAASTVPKAALKTPSHIRRTSIWQSNTHEQPPTSPAGL
jgi:C-terminal processing protease CtpA/Prc